MENSWYVYIIRCQNKALYTGCTNNLIRRWRQHQEGKAAKYTRANRPEAVVHVEELPGRSEACKREYQIKQYSRQQKELLVANSIPGDEV